MHVSPVPRSGRRPYLPGIGSLPRRSANSPRWQARKPATTRLNRSPAGLAFALLGVLGAALAGPGFAASAPRALLLDAALARDAIVAVGERGTLLRSPDHAITWHEANRPTTATLTGVSFAPDGVRGWAVGHDALILTTADGGRTWSRQFQGESLEDSFLDVLAIDVQHAIAVGAYGLCLETTSGGKTWTRRKIIEEDYHLNRITRGPAGTLYLAGEHGTLLRSTNNGRRWVAISTPYAGSFYGILPIDRRTLLAYGLRGRVYRSSDDGDSWHLISTPQPVLLAAAARLKDNGIVIVGHARSALLSRDGGQSFAPFSNPPAFALAELIELPDGRLFAIGEAGAHRLDLGNKSVGGSGSAARSPVSQTPSAR